MARIITKELALKIVKKLEATKIDSRSKAHDGYAVLHEGVHLGIISRSLQASWGTERA
jgi:hypothetical protein